MALPVSVQGRTPISVTGQSLLPSPQEGVAQWFPKCVVLPPGGGGKIWVGGEAKGGKEGGGGGRGRQGGIRNS